LEKSGAESGYASRRFLKRPEYLVSQSLVERFRLELVGVEPTAMAAPPDSFLLRPSDQFAAGPHPAQLLGHEQDVDIECAPERTAPKAPDRHVSRVLKQDGQQVRFSIADGLLVEIPQAIPEALERTHRWFIGEKKAMLHYTPVGRADDRDEASVPTNKFAERQPSPLRPEAPQFLYLIG
jgi:hypothetical protein